MTLFNAKIVFFLLFLFLFRSILTLAHCWMLNKPYVEKSLSNKLKLNNDFI